MLKPYVKKLGSMDYRTEAWKTSRPGFDFSKFQLSDVGYMDISLNSMKVYTLEIRSSIYFRDLLFSMRPIHPWAQSLRSRPMEEKNLIVSSEYGYNEKQQTAIKKASRMLADGVPQDLVREVLPMALSTVYTVTIDLRTLIGFLNMISEIKFLSDNYLYVFLEALDDIDEYLLNQIRSFKDFYLLNQPEYKIRTEWAGSMIFGSYIMKSALMSQFIRKHNSLVKTDLWNLAYINAHDFYQSDKFQVAFYIDGHQYESMIKLRSHWFSDWSYDMWGYIVGDYIKNMSAEDFWNFIPNGAGKPDPYFGDTISRVTGEENSIPCPIMCEAPYLIDKRLEELGDNPVIQKYLEIKSFIPDNPDNEYRKMYERLGR